MTRLLFIILFISSTSSFAAGTNCFAPSENETNIKVDVRDLFISQDQGAERVKLFEKSDPTGQEIQIISASTGKALSNVGMLDPGRTNFGVIKAGSCSFAISQLKNNGADGSYVSRTVAPIFFIGNKRAVLFDNIPSVIWGGSSDSCSNPKPYSAAYFNGKFYVSYGQNKLIELDTDGSYRVLSSKNRIGEIHSVGGTFYAEFFNEVKDSTLSTLNEYDPVTDQSNMIDYMVTGSFIEKSSFQRLIFHSRANSNSDWEGLSNYKILNKAGQLVNIGSPAKTNYVERDLDIEIQYLSTGGILARTYLQGHWRNKQAQEEVTLINKDGQTVKKWELDGERLSLAYKNHIIHLFENSSNDQRTNFKTKQVTFDESGNELASRSFYNSFDSSTPYEVIFKDSSPLRSPENFGMWLWTSRISGDKGFYTSIDSANIYDFSHPLPVTTLTSEEISKWIILNCESDGVSHLQKVNELKKRLLAKNSTAPVSVINDCKVTDFSIFGFEPARTGIVTLQDGSDDRITVQFLRLVGIDGSYKTKINYCLDSDPWSGCGKKGFNKSYMDLINP